jgi:hypothetical protein
MEEKEQGGTVPGRGDGMEAVACAWWLWRR